jgi:succinate dehydrogenase / fumarate reductase cytochrome b subunit
MANNNKPVIYLNLLQIRFPVTAFLSIGHRITGVLLFLCIPLLIYMLELSLTSPEGFQVVSNLLKLPQARILTVLLAWVFAHHLYSGMRFLLMDMDIGVNKQFARRSAWLVFIAGLLTMLIVAWCLS